MDRPFFTHKVNTMIQSSRKQYHNLTGKPSFTAQGIERVSDTMGWASRSGGGSNVTDTTEGGF